MQQQSPHARLQELRIHVKSAIERLKDFKVFQGNLPLTLAKLADQMLIVCGGQDKYHRTLYSHSHS